jgi:ribose transport system permease protein
VAEPPAAARSALAGWRSIATTARRHPWVGPLVAVLVVYVLFVVLSPETFARPQNLVTMMRQTVVVGIAAAGMTLVIAMGGIDLSVGSAVALTTVVIATSLRAGWGPVSAALAGIAAATAAGTAVGVLVTKLRITPFIVTLGAMSILRGAAKGFADEQKIDADPRGLDTLVAPTHAPWMLVPPSVWTLGLCALLAAGVLRYTRLGRHLLAIGSNEAAALLCGVRVHGVKIAVYALAAAFSGVAGVMEFATLTVGDPTDSVGLELEVIASVVIGGGSLTGGKGSVLGALFGAFLMTVIRTGCTHVGLPNWVQELVTGAIIVLAVALDMWRTLQRRTHT